ncbi:MAG: hypothetical protein WC869_10360 [Phycisphaerae bacterium]
MDPSATYAALQAKHAAIAGVVSAPTDRPATLAPAALPCVLTWLGPASWETLSSDYEEQEREWIVRYYHAPLAQGQWFANVSLIADVLPLFLRAYRDDPSLGGAVDRITTVRDNGDDGVLLYAGIPYAGFELRVKIYEKGDI